MDIKELNSFNLSDAIKFHTELNPKLWHNSKLDPAVKKQLLIIAADFMDELGIYDIDVEDITVSGSNAAFTYTPHSDLDLHILVDMSKLPNDEVYRELFQAKKTLYNDSHDITIHGVPVELYVQDTNQPVVSLGEYSILNDRWIKIPKKRKATLDQAATKAKYDTLSDLIKLAMKTHDSNRVSNVLKMIKRYRQAGLSKGGEFSPENLAFKIIRTQGAIDALYALRDKLHSEELTIEEKQLDSTPIRPTVELDHLAERLSKEFEDYDLTEYRSQEIIHANPKINILKSLARNNKYGSARFTIDKDGYLKAGDSVAFVHQDLEPAYGRVIIRGYINFHDGNYNYRTMGPYDNLPKDHPILRKFEKAGIENGNIDTTLNEALDRDGAIQQILKLKNTSGRTQGEIESATNIINKLMQKFNIRPEEINKPKVTKLDKKIAATQYEKQAASDALKAEWERFKRGLFKEDAKLDEAYTTKQEVIGHFAREARKRGKNVNLAMKQGAEAWERGWRGPESNKPKEPKKPKEIKPYDPERYKNVRLPYRDDDDKDDDDTNEDYDPVNETEDRKAAVLKIQKHLNKKYGANLDLDGILGPLTRKSINKFMPRAKVGLADEPDKTTAVQGKKLKETESKPTTTINFRTWKKGGVPRHSFVVVRDGKEIAGGEISKDNEWDDDRSASVQDIVVHPDYRRKGFATKIYNEIERKFNYKLRPSDDVKPDGQEFWKARSNLDEASDYSQYEGEIEDFVQSLSPDEVGVEEFGPYRVHFEGFTDECQEDAERRCNLPSDDPQYLADYDDVYDEVIGDFVI